MRGRRVALAAAVWYASPQGWRPHVVQVTYTGYLALMSLLWGFLFVASLGGVYFPIMLLTRLARGGRPGDAPMTRGQLFFLGFHFAEEGEPVGEEMLREVIARAPRSKLAKAAKNKLALEAES